MRVSCRIAAMLLGAGIGGCTSESPAVDVAAPSTDVVAPATDVASTATTTSRDASEVEVVVEVDAAAPGAAISPLILGISGDLAPDEIEAAGITLASWGGNPATRFNYMIGHAWNSGADYEYRNTNYGNTGDVARQALEAHAGLGLATRFAVPTLGWIARNDDPDTCSFPDDEGGCTGAGDANCADPGPITDPRRANVPSTPEMVADWMAGLVADGHEIRFIAMDNEPDLWGFTHYDVHPECATYEEVLTKYIEYASAIEGVAPEAELIGPAICCWFEYWGNAPGPADGSGTEFVQWFLESMRAHDESVGHRTLDALDVHFYPQSDVYNDRTDDETNARRLRSTRSLWDPSYVDESWIGQPVYFIPRLQRIIEAAYPGTPLFISEWNFGGDAHINGALAIADVLGIYGREGVYAAAYWRNPPSGSPGYHAFAMHGNYDGAGTRFGGLVVSAESSDPSAVSAFGAVDEDTALVRVMLINRKIEDDVTVGLRVNGVEPDERVSRFTYSGDDLTAIVADEIEFDGSLVLPASSITVVEVDARG